LGELTTWSKPELEAPGGSKSFKAWLLSSSIVSDCGLGILGHSDTTGKWLSSCCSSSRVCIALICCVRPLIVRNLEGQYATKHENHSFGSVTQVVGGRGMLNRAQKEQLASGLLKLEKEWQIMMTRVSSQITLSPGTSSSTTVTYAVA
jgi:hypothetical protein